MYIIDCSFFILGVFANSPKSIASIIVDFPLAFKPFILITELGSKRAKSIVVQPRNRIKLENETFVIDHGSASVCSVFGKYCLFSILCKLITFLITSSGVFSWIRKDFK
eukprot:NODE_207_length_14754_cov_0.677994.p7 type:complete len:109 gc:universal NODE_207_length_14754_cov_0.677994:12533-12859(+)